jgi:hypothetical protein
MWRRHKDGGDEDTMMEGIISMTLGGQRQFLSISDDRRQTSPAKLTTKCNNSDTESFKCQRGPGQTTKLKLAE